MAARRAYSEDGSDGAYSDDFISDDERRTVTPFKDRNKDRDRTRGRGGNPLRARGRGRGRAGRGGSRNSEPINVKHSYDNVTKRVMSASRHKVNELRNQVEELKLQVKELDQENKLYKKMQYRQERALRGFEDKENDLPRILDKHNNEVRSLKEQNRRLREKYEKSDRFLRDAEDELEKTKRRMNKYKEICEQKELAERDELSRKLTKAEIDMEEKDVKIRELDRHIEILKKNHRHELGIEVARQKELKRQLDEMTNRQSKVETQLRDKEKALEYSNIYANRIALAESGSDITQSRKLKKKAPSLTDLTPRDKAKFYEEKRREEVKKQKDMKAEIERKKKEKWEAVERQKDTPIQDSESKSPSLSPDRGIEFNFKSIDLDLEEREMRAKQREETDRQQEDSERRDLEHRKRELERRQDEDRRKREEDEKQRQHKFELEKENNTRREREERERRDREERESREREKKEREERERKELEQQRKEQVERERREKEKAEQERRFQLERERLDNDPSIAEERRKKDELLRKLQDMDKIGNNKPVPDPFMASSSAGRLSKENSSGYNTPGKRGDPKEYSFTKPINNLHKGKPSHEEVTIPSLQRQQRRRASKDDDDIGGYNPSFGPTRGGGKPSGVPATKPLSLFDDDPPPFIATKQKESKPTNLLADLFGPQANAGNNAPSQNKPKNDTFFITDNSPPPSNAKKTTNSSSAFPWDTSYSPSKNSNSQSAFGNDVNGGSTLFGGGAALIEDNNSSSGNRVLPRRTRQPNVSTFAVKPSVTAVDNFDDEIEEVVL